MAEHAHTMATPDVVRLAGSSSPTGEAPAFKPVALATSTPRPGKTLHPSRLFLASDEAEMSALATRLVALIKLEDRLSTRWNERSLQEPLTARDWRCELIQGRAVSRIGRDVAHLAKMTAPSRAATTFKAHVLLELKLAGWEPHIRDDLGLSLTRDVLNLALVDACRAAEDAAELGSGTGLDHLARSA